MPYESVQNIWWVLPGFWTNYLMVNEKPPQITWKSSEGECLLRSARNKGTNPVCHVFLNHSRFYRYLFLIDQDIPSVPVYVRHLAAPTVVAYCKAPVIRASLTAFDLYWMLHIGLAWVLLRHGGMPPSHHNALYAFPRLKGLSRHHYYPGDCIGAWPDAQTPQVTHWTTRSLSADPFTLAQVVGWDLSVQPLLAGRAGELCSTRGNKPVARSLVGPTPYANQ